MSGMTLNRLQVFVGVHVDNVLPFSLSLGRGGFIEKRRWNLIDYHL